VDTDNWPVSYGSHPNGWPWFIVVLKAMGTLQFQEFGNLWGILHIKMI
jgi:hypothetical protein